MVAGVIARSPPITCTPSNAGPKQTAEDGAPVVGVTGIVLGTAEGEVVGVAMGTSEGVVVGSDDVGVTVGLLLGSAVGILVGCVLG